jgi:hypothetical protein
MKKWKNASKRGNRGEDETKKGTNVSFDTENQRCSGRLAGKSPG